MTEAIPPKKPILPKLSKDEIRAEINRRRFNRINELFPDGGPNARDGYVKHLEFFGAGSKYRERLFRAANRVGKTEAGAYEVTLHLTGLYPAWWKGKRFNKPVNVLVSGETGKLVRDSLQEKLLGSPAEQGTGIIPKDLILDTRPRPGVADAIDVARITHVHGISTLQFQSYDQGRIAFQATARDVIWMDEEPPLDIYSEALTRTMTTNGIVMTTFTPLLGMSSTVQFLEQKAQTGKIAVVTASWDDAPHLTEEAKEEMLAAYPPHERAARSKGIPAMGEVSVYPIREEDFVISPIPIPKHWRHVYGLDVGWNNTAAVFGAYDDDNDILYITSDYKRGQEQPSTHASAIKIRAKGERQPGVVDPASAGSNQIDGRKLIDMYRELGLNLQPADNSIHEGVGKVWMRLSSGRMKVFNTCNNILQEYRMYRWGNNNKPVKENDHCMDAMRYLVVSGIQIARAGYTEKKSIFHDFLGGGTSWMGN